ncbi:MAG: PrsW family intrarane metalloprotease [Microbacteriaceae bacterium]|nr:PrsW family intrarane metalloprotease [Microbacteriaceae bacterium]
MTDGFSSQGAQPGSEVQYGPVATNSTPVVDHPHQVVVTRPPRHTGGTIALATVGFIVLSIVVLLVAGYLFLVLGPGALFWAIVLASLPCIAVLFGIRWIDRWEPEPRLALLFAFLWGAAMSVFIALIFSGITQAYTEQAGISDSFGTLFFETVIQAPIVEESAKGFGILLLLWSIRRTFDGPVDGLVYGATIAIGFAFSENLQYFGLAIIGDQGAGGIGETFVVRAILSPFAHVMFTACTGLLLGLAARRASAAGAIGYYVLGLIPAILLHAFWNSSSFWADNWFTFYFLVQVPLFVLGIIGVVRLRRHEQRLTRVRLTEYANAGWFTQSEVNQLSTGAGRRQAIAWASRYRLKKQYEKFVQDATHLAFTRQRLIGGKDRIGAQRYEADLLRAIDDDRRALGALPPLLVRVD